jgi:hypothetical protein
MIDAAKATYWNVTNKYYLVRFFKILKFFMSLFQPVRYIDSCNFANTYCQNLGGDLVSIHSSAENALVTSRFSTNFNSLVKFFRSCRNI